MTDKIWPDDAREKWRAHVTGWRDDPRGRCLLVSAQVPGGGGKRMAVRIGWESVQQGGVYPPALWETYEENRDGFGDVENFLQAVVDAAWEAGIKPVQAKAGDGEIGAVRYHLEDMRMLVMRSAPEIKEAT